MAETKVLTTSQYAKLVADIRKLVTEGRAKAEEAAKNVLVQTYWEIGKRIVEEGLTENASYGESVIEDLSDELGIEERTLYYCVSFFKAYKVNPRGQNLLTWSHYRELLGVKDDSVRLMLEEKADKEAWTRDELVKAIRSEAEGSPQGGGKKGKRLIRPTEPTYVYKAVPQRVIDGDTMILKFDLGFQVWKEQRIRLAEIDCPAMDSAKGQQACKYVQEQLAKADFLMVKTHKVDIYGRYVGHVFYTLQDDQDNVDVFKNGRYLNQELLEKGLAVTL